MTGGPPPGKPPQPRTTRLRSLLARDLVRAGLHTYFFAGLTLAANLISGIVTARALAPAGRGEVVAIAMLAQNVGLLFACGCTQAVSYRYASEPQSAPRLLTAWAVLIVPLSLGAIVAGELALPALFSSQSHATIDAARIYLFSTVLVLWLELTNGLLLGAHDYLFVNVVRFAQPALFTVSLVVVWRTTGLTVVASLICAAASSLLIQTVASARVLRKTGGFGSLDLRLGVETLWYGFRGHGALLANALNQRLDLLIMPAFIAAAGLGLYSIAANVSLIVSSLANSLATVVLPAAARAGGGRRTVIASLQAALAVAAVLAAVLLVLARPALELVYGAKFAGAAPSLRVLLPGTVLLAGALILIAGLYAENRPTIATGVQVTGLVATVVGLVVFLPGSGIIVAAVVSTVAYSTVFLSSVLAYKKVARLRWSDFVRGASTLRGPTSNPA